MIDLTTNLRNYVEENGCMNVTFCDDHYAHNFQNYKNLTLMIPDCLVLEHGLYFYTLLNVLELCYIDAINIKSVVLEIDDVLKCHEVSLTLCFV